MAYYQIGPLFGQFPSRNATSVLKWTQRSDLSKQKDEMAKRLPFFTFFQTSFQKHLNIVLSTFDNNKNKC